MNSTEASPTTPFLISANPEINFLTLLSRPLLKTMEHLLGLKKCQQLYDQLEGNMSANQFPRLRTYALELAHPNQSLPGDKPQTNQQRPLIAALRVERLEAEIINLPKQQRLLQSGEFTVLSFNAEQAPNLLREIGRLFLRQEIAVA